MCEDDIETEGNIWDLGTLQRIHQTAEWGRENLHILHLAALPGKDFFELFVRAGAALEDSRGSCPSLLLAAVGKQLLPFPSGHPRSLEGTLHLIDLLATENTSADSMTPLQLAVWESMSFTGPALTIENFKHAYQICERLLKNGIDVNGVGDDSVNMARVALACTTFFPEPEDEKESETVDEIQSIRSQRDRMTDAAQHIRGTSWRYDTPLRILINKEEEFNDIEKRKGKFSGLTELDLLEIQRFIKVVKDLLISHGAVALHLFPVKGLPGYIQEDIDAW
jgi:hypothetical protein